MNFEVVYALKLLGSPVEPYLIEEAIDNYDITSKRYAMEALMSLDGSKTIKTFIEKIRLY